VVEVEQGVSRTGNPILHLTTHSSMTARVGLGLDTWPSGFKLTGCQAGIDLGLR